jgi:hypothetical protein
VPGVPNNVDPNNVVPKDVQNVPKDVQQGVQGALPGGGGGRDRSSSDRQVVDYLMAP